MLTNTNHSQILELLSLGQSARMREIQIAPVQILNRMVEEVTMMLNM